MQTRANQPGHEHRFRQDKSCGKDRSWRRCTVLTPEISEAVHAVTGASGVNLNAPALKASCFGLPLLAPGALNGAIPTNDPYETNFIDHGQRNIFRQPWQIRPDMSVVKTTQITERYSLKYELEIFNLTNTTSFDIPINDVSQNINFNGFPWTTPPPPLAGNDSALQPQLHRLSLRLSDARWSGHHEQDYRTAEADPDVTEPHLLVE